MKFSRYVMERNANNGNAGNKDIVIMDTAKYLQDHAQQTKDRLNERLVLESFQSSRLDENILWLERLVTHVEKEEESLWQ